MKYLCNNSWLKNESRTNREIRTNRQPFLHYSCKLNLDPPSGNIDPSSGNMSHPPLLTQVEICSVPLLTQVENYFVDPLSGNWYKRFEQRRNEKDKLMKYWIADINERNGEYEYTTPIRFKAKNLKEAISKQMYHVSTWYGYDNMTYNTEDECYYNDYVAVSDGALTQIDKHTYDKLSGHYSLPDMSRVVGR